MIVKYLSIYEILEQNYILFAAIAIALAIVTLKIIFFKKSISIGPVNHFKCLFHNNPEWYFFFSLELFKNFKKYKIGNDIYELILSQLNQAQILSLMNELKDGERKLWKKEVSSFHEITSSERYLNFLVIALTGQKPTVSRKNIVARLISMKKSELITFLISKPVIQHHLSHFIKPTLYKMVLEGMGAQKYQKMLGMMLNKEHVLLESKNVDQALLNELVNFTDNLNLVGNFVMSDLCLLMDAEKEHLYYCELYKQKRIDLLLDSVQKKIPFQLLKLFPAPIINEFFTFEETWIISYLESYSKGQRKELYIKAALSPNEEMNLESKMLFHASTEEKFKSVCRASYKILNLCQDIPDWDSTYRMIIAKWTGTLNKDVLSKSRFHHSRSLSPS